MRISLLLILALLLVPASQAFAGVVQLKELKTIDLGLTPKQVTSTVDGRRVYVLTNDARILVYTLGGELQGSLNVDPAIDHITPLGPQHLLLQKSSRNQAVLAMLELSHQIDISNSPFRGPADAPVAIVVFDDFECPYCAKAVPLLKEITDKYPDKVKLVFKNFPLSIHRNSRTAALTALAANRQGKFWELHDLLYANFNRLNPQKIDELAQQAGVNMEQLKKDRQDPALAKLIERDVREGTDIGVRGTPSIYVNGRQLEDRSIGAFSQLIEEELAKHPASGQN